MDEEQVADIFVRINSQCVKLNQADFILTLLSVFWEKGRKDLEEFCRPSSVAVGPGSHPSPYNHFVAPDPDQLLRVAVALGFRRGRLKSVYQILRGKNLDTGSFSTDYAYIEWPENVAIGEAPPSVYLPKMRERFSNEDWAHMCRSHALPTNWESMEYDVFLGERRKLMAAVIRRGYEKLLF